MQVNDSYMICNMGVFELLVFLFGVYEFITIVMMFLILQLLLFLSEISSLVLVSFYLLLLYCCYYCYHYHYKCHCHHHRNCQFITSISNTLLLFWIHFFLDTDIIIIIPLSCRFTLPCSAGLANANRPIYHKCYLLLMTICLSVVYAFSCVIACSLCKIHEDTHSLWAEYMFCTLMIMSFFVTIYDVCQINFIWLQGGFYYTYLSTV